MKIKITDQKIAEYLCANGTQITRQAVGQYRSGRLNNANTACKIQAAEVALKRAAVKNLKREVNALARELSI